jgi:hypothetical protein
MKKFKMKKWFQLSLMLVCFVMAGIALSSFVDESEESAQPHGSSKINLGHHGGPYTGSEFKTTNYILGTLTVDASGGITADGKVINLGLKAGAQVSVGYTDYICTKCFFGSTWCNSCSADDDNRVITW